MLKNVTAWNKPSNKELKRKISHTNRPMSVANKIGYILGAGIAVNSLMRLIEIVGTRGMDHEP